MHQFDCKKGILLKGILDRPQGKVFMLLVGRGAANLGRWQQLGNGQKGQSCCDAKKKYRQGDNLL